MRVLDAAKRLGADGVDCAVLHVPTIKPLDVDTIVAEAGKGGRLVVTAENHSVTGGLGEAVAGCLMRAGVHVPFRQIGSAGCVSGRGRPADAARSIRAVGRCGDRIGEIMAVKQARTCD